MPINTIFNIFSDKLKKPYKNLLFISYERNCGEQLMSKRGSFPVGEEGGEGRKWINHSLWSRGWKMWEILGNMFPLFGGEYKSGSRQFFDEVAKENID